MLKFEILASIFLLGSSNESLSSIFSQTNRKFTGTTDINDSTNINSAAVATEGKLNINVKLSSYLFDYLFNRQPLELLGLFR